MLCAANCRAAQRLKRRQVRIVFRQPCHDCSGGAALKRLLDRPKPLLHDRAHAHHQQLFEHARRARSAPADKEYAAARPTLPVWRARISGASTGSSKRISPTPHGASSSINVRCGQPPSGSSRSSAPKRVGTVRTLESPASELARHTRAPNADRKLLEDCSMHAGGASVVDGHWRCRHPALCFMECAKN